MAEIQSTTAAKHSKGKRMNKKSTRVDLTPMVDLGFLLITFFVFTTTMAKPRVMGLVSPNDNDPTVQSNVCESCAITIILDKNNRIFYYEGIPDNNAVVKETSFTNDAVRKVLTDKLASVKKIKGTTDDMVMIIKANDEALFKNFVDIADEVTINNVKHYFIDEVNDTDRKLIKPLQ
ncbi:ExbD/TolR family protein [Ferruginibacter sp.]